MILSMTGFGEASAEEGGVAYRVEIRSLNNRYFKASIKLPEAFQRFETEIDKQLRSRVGRGSISFSLRIRDENPASAFVISTPMLAEYVRQLREVAGDAGNQSIDLAGLLEIPGVVQPPEIDNDWLNARFQFVRKMTDQAIDQLIEMREREGRSLFRDLMVHCDVVRNQVAMIRDRAPSVVTEYRDRLRKRVQQLLDGMQGTNMELHEDALCREVAIFAERCDVNEEASRIDSHLDQFATLCNAPEPTGRKLDFLAQELLREGNTIGSKSNDAEISRLVVEIKAAIDRIKEQVQNVE